MRLVADPTQTIYHRPNAPVETAPDLPADENYATDLANAEEMKERFGDRVRFNADSGKFMLFSGGVWRTDAKGQVQAFAMKIARETRERFEHLPAKDLSRAIHRAESAQGVQSVLTLFRSLPGVAVTSDQLDADDFLLNCTNGIVDLRTGQMSPHHPNALMTKQVPVAFNYAAPCPMWMKVLNRIMDGKAELIEYLQRIAGLALSGDASIHELYVAHGGGANGKSLFWDTISGVMGEYAGTAPDSLLMVRSTPEHPTEIADLAHKRLVVASETEEGGRLRLQLVKKMTGDARLKGRFMRRDFFEFRRTHKLVLVTNNRPIITESGEAAWRRIRLLPFTVTIPAEERDPQLLDKLRNEWQGILGWAVKGSIGRITDGMRPPAEVLAVTAEYQAASDPLADFVAERCILGETFRAKRSDLYTDYTGWASRINEKRPLDRTAFYDRVRRIDGVKDSEWKADGGKVRGFTGIQICPSAGGGR